MLPCFAYSCAHTCCWAWGFLCFLAILRPPSGSGSTVSSGYSFSTRVPYLRDGVTPVGSRFVCPRSTRRFSVPVWVRSTGQFMVGPHASVCGVSARPVPHGGLPGGPCCVSELRLSLAPASVLPCPMLGFRVASTTLAVGLGLSWAPCPTSAGWGLVPLSVARLAPCSRWRPLTGWSSL